jgi:hypothetical protein
VGAKTAAGAWRWYRGVCLGPGGGPDALVGSGGGTGSPFERSDRVGSGAGVARRGAIGDQGYLPQSLLGQALDYALGQWSTLTVYLDDGRVEIDNNLVENAIRPTAIGKKNWLFIGDAAAGQRSAIIYTVIESCRRRSLDPYAYLREVLTRLPDMTNWQIPEVTPETWAKTRQPVQRQAPS